MPDLITNPWEHLKTTTAQVRLVIGVSFMLIVGAAGVMTYRAANSPMTPAFSGLDSAQFSAVTSALAAAGIQFDTTSPPAPYVVFVPFQSVYRARNAIATNSALNIGPEGASSIFGPAAKPLQEIQEGGWQDLEMQLEAFSFVRNAAVHASGPPPQAIFQHRPPTVTVVVHMRRSARLDSTQRRALASTVRNGANVPEVNITITDQSGSILFDGANDLILGEFLRFEKEWADQWTGRAQDQLDIMFGPGMATVSVTGEFDFARTESNGEAYGPSATQTQVGAPALERITVSLAVHDTLSDRLPQAEDLVKRFVRFDEQRDQLFSAAFPLGREVDEAAYTLVNGKVVARDGIVTIDSAYGVRTQEVRSED